MTPHPKPEPRRTLAVDHRPCVLIVDGDRVSERAIELALAPCDYAVEWARDGEAALDIMRSTKVDAVVADSVLSDLSGSTLMRRTFELCGPGAPAFLFVSVDRAVATRVGLLLGGAVDYLVKPFVADELRARVSNTIEARRAARAIATRGVTGLAGDCSHIPISDLLTMLEFARKSGAVYVSVGPATGRLVLDAGRVIHAEVGTLSGPDAFFILLHHQTGLFRFEPGDIEAPHTLNARVSELLIESAVREDTERHLLDPKDQEALRRTEAGLRELGIIKSPIPLRRRPESNEPPPLLPAAQRLAIAIADPLFLGDLMLGAEAPATTAMQFHVELWASLADGVAAMLALASPPGYQVLIAALTGNRDRLILHFETDKGVLIVTLVDTDGGTSVPPALPQGVIVAPPRGELVAMAPHRLGELTLRLSARESVAVVTVGGHALQSTVAALVADSDAPRHLGIAATGEHELRDHLTGLVRLWMASR